MPEIYPSFIQMLIVLLKRLGLTLINSALRCPSALVWNYLGEGKSQNSVFSGSPLDLLPCAPSSLPMPNSNEAPHVRSQLLVAEQEIVLRGRAAEGRWSTGEIVGVDRVDL